MRKLSEWEDNTPLQNWAIVSASICLVLFAGLMSGLTLGLMSLDMTQMEVLKRSGTPTERKHALKIMPVIQNSHFLLVTLLLCNAGAMEALPLFLDRLANPITAIILSATAVLFFGEIIPQSVCTRYGLVIGANLAWLVRVLMVVCSPVAWPLGKLLDWLLGPEHHVLFRRQQLKALVDIHGEERGLGGKLSEDETKVITGALDLTNKIAYRSMTPLDKVFMLSTDDVLNERMLRAIVESGHSRVPIHRAGDKTDLIGLILVKELLQYKMSRDVPVCLLKMRSLPRLSADTRMYDMLKLFQTGRSHMAVLTQPLPLSPPTDPDAAPSTSTAVAAADALDRAQAAAAHAPPSPSHALAAAAAAQGPGPGLPPAPSAPALQPQGHGMQAQAAPGAAQAASQPPGGTAEDSSSAGLSSAVQAPARVAAGTTGAAPSSTAPDQEPQETTRLLSGVQQPSDAAPKASMASTTQGAQPLSEKDGLPAGRSKPGAGGTSRDPPSAPPLDEHLEEDEELDLDLLEEEEEEEAEAVKGDDHHSRLSVVSLLQKKNKAKRSKAKELQARRLRRYKMVPQLAPPGQPIGIITIEDVIEELIRAEIVDETDRFVDNEHLVRVEQAMLESSLPERLRRVVAGNVGVMLRASLQQQQQPQRHASPLRGPTPALSSLQQQRPQGASRSSKGPLSDESTSASTPLLGHQ